MLKVPQSVLKRLICAYCGGYLSFEPVMVDKSEKQICGKCFDQLAPNVKHACIRQIGLEAVAEMLIFPCRHHQRGCNYTFLWNHENNHEAQCFYRNRTLSQTVIDESVLITNNNNHSREYTNNTQQLKLTVNYDILSNSSCGGESGVKFNLLVEPTKTTFGARSMAAAAAAPHSAIVIDGAFNLRTDANHLIYCNAEIRRRDDAVESVAFDAVRANTANCSNCHTAIIDEIYHCLFGHGACRSCRGGICVVCSTSIHCEPRTHCKNTNKGCTALHPAFDGGQHEIDCEFNDTKCPITNCGFVDVLHKLKHHLEQTHPDNVVLTNAITKTVTTKDDNWIFICYDKLFECKFYYFENFVEFIVLCIGANNAAVNFNYEIVALSNCKYVDGADLRKTAPCFGWNDFALAKSVVFPLKNKYWGCKKIRFDVDICIRAKINC